MAIVLSNETITALSGLTDGALVATVRQLIAAHAPSPPRENRISVAASLAALTAAPPKKGASRARVNPISAEDEEFSRFWTAYGKAVAKRDALRAFGKARQQPSWPGIDAIVAKLAELNKTDQWLRDGGAFKPYPATWLNGERWLDEVDAVKRQPSGEQARPARSGYLAPTPNEEKNNGLLF